MAALMLDRLRAYLTIAGTNVRITMSKRMPDPKMGQIGLQNEKKIQKISEAHKSVRYPAKLSNVLDFTN